MATKDAIGFTFHLWEWPDPLDSSIPEYDLESPNNYAESARKVLKSSTRADHSDCNSRDRLRECGQKQPAAKHCRLHSGIEARTPGRGSRRPGVYRLRERGESAAPDTDFDLAVP